MPEYPILPYGDKKTRDMIKPGRPLVHKAIRNFERHFVKATDQEETYGKRETYEELSIDKVTLLFITYFPL